MSGLALRAAGALFAAPQWSIAQKGATTAAGRVLAILREWRRRARARADLAALDDRTLADIGISRTEAEFLANKPFWRK